jgi:ATP-dependent DNA ligase I
MTAPRTLFRDIADVSAKVASTRSRLQKKRHLVDFIAAMPAQDKAAAVGWLVAKPTCGPVGAGPAQLWELMQRPVVAAIPIELREVERVLDDVRRAGRTQVFGKVASLFDKLSESERVFLTGALTGSLRQGSLAGVMLLALADLAGRPGSEVRRAVMLTGSIVATAKALLEGDAHQARQATSLVLFRPLAPMLAESAESLEEALGLCSEPLVEWKIDGVRAQVHKSGDRVAVYSRQGRDITSGCASVVSVLRTVSACDAVLDGELVVVEPNDRPRSFQDSFSAIASGVTREGDRLRLYVFDCLYRDGVELLSKPLSRRLEELEAILPQALGTPRVRGVAPDEVRRFAEGALGAGHEGVMVKDLGSPYALGSRGRAWQKIKQARTVDLVVLAAEWGHGRRSGRLSNLHLGARLGDGFCMVGKTFKGLTDELLRWQTVELERRCTRRAGNVVHVLPELVVEIRFNDVQRSSRYPGGIALRFARVVRYRPDKSPSDAELLSSLVARLPDSGVLGAKNKQLSLF